MYGIKTVVIPWHCNLIWASCTMPYDYGDSVLCDIGGMAFGRERLKYFREKQCRYHFVQDMSHVNCPGIELMLLVWLQFLNYCGVVSIVALCFVDLFEISYRRPRYVFMLIVIYSRKIP
jgi:hypothetical protein